MNHSTLRKFEVPIIRSLGYEVYLPKSFPYDEGNLSASLDYSLDDALSIPKSDLEILNAENLYLGMSPEAARVANEHFEIAFCGFFPEQLAALIRNYKNVVVMRPFGLSNGVTYTNVVADSLGFFFLGELQKAKDRFWFGQAYDHLADVENGVFKQRAITLPLGLDDARVTNEWAGTDAKVLFVCPRIETSPYFNWIYQNFRRKFGDLPYIVGGAQPIPVADPNVAGHLPRAEYDRMMRETRVMYYHSKEERHLHYHPLEAVRLGMPLVFMAGGMLDRLGGKKLPGRVKSEDQAHRMLSRILNGDQPLIDEIKASQGVLLHTMTRDYCEPIWREEFKRIEASIENNQKAKGRPKARRRIAVFLPQAYLGGTLNMVKLLAKMIKDGSRQQGDEVEVVFAHLDSWIYSRTEFDDLTKHGIEVRPFKWKIIDEFQLSDIQAMQGFEVRRKHGRFALPVDGATDFLDCDFWFMGSDRVDEPVAPIRPYVLFTHDYLQRYFPELLMHWYERPFIQTAREAVAVLANTPHTVEDVVQYVGVPRSRVVMVPHVAELDQFKVAFAKGGARSKGDYFQWTTNLGPHKNHVITLNALNAYYEAGGTLECHITGVDSDKLDPEVETDEAKLQPHVVEARRLIASRPALKKKLVILGNTSNDEYVAQLSGAKFLLHNVIIDNGTLCSVEAAYGGTPTLSSDYPPMRYISERYALNATFFESRDTKQLTDRLLWMERNWEEMARKLPTQEFLDGLSWQAQAAHFYDKLQHVMG